MVGLFIIVMSSVSIGRELLLRAGLESVTVARLPVKKSITVGNGLSLIHNKGKVWQLYIL